MTITLLKNFTFVGAQNDTFVTDWLAFPAENKQALLHAHVQTMNPAGPATGLEIQLQTGFDTVESEDAGTTLTIATATTGSLVISTGLMAYVRVVLTNPDATALSCVVTITLQPKNS